MRKPSILIAIFIILSLNACQAQGLPEGEGAVWQLVVIGDSSLWELGEAYAAQIEKDMGVEVELEDFANEAGSAGEVLEVLRTGKTFNSRLKKLPEIMKEAEVVVIFLNPLESIVPDKPLDLNGCFMSTAPSYCAPDSWTQYTEDMKTIWAEIFKLRKGKAIILRATDLYSPMVVPWKEAGVFEACTQCWVNMSDASRLAAEAYDIPFLSRLEAFGGPNFDEDPRANGFIDEDGEHPSPLMGQRTAELLAQLGYEPVTPP